MLDCIGLDVNCLLAVVGLGQLTAIAESMGYVYHGDLGAPPEPTLGHLKMPQFSGIVVACHPGQLEPTIERLAQEPNVDVYQRDLATHRVVVVLEAHSAQEQEDTLRRLQSLEGVVRADLVYHTAAFDGGSA